MLPTEWRTDDDIVLERLRRAVYAPTGGAAALAAYRRALEVRSAARPDGPPAPAAGSPAPPPARSSRLVAVIVLAGLVAVVVAAGIVAVLGRPSAAPMARPTLATRDQIVSTRAGDVAAAHRFVRNSVRAPVGSEPVDFFAQRGLTRPGTGPQVLQIAATERHLAASGRVGLGLLAPATSSHGSVLVLCDRPARFLWRIDTGATSSAAPTSGPAASPAIRSSGTCGGDLVAATFDVPGGTLLTALTLTLPRGTDAVLEVAVTD